MKLTVNGDERTFDASDLSVAGLLAELALTDRRVAVEVNRRIVRRADHAEHRLEDGDVVEIVHFVGGGA